MIFTRIRSIVLVCLAIVFSIPTRAEGGSIVTLEKAIQLALEKNFDIQISKNSEEEASADVKASQADYLPTLSLNLRDSFNKQALSSDVFENTEQPTTATENSSIELRQRLDTGGTLTIASTINRRETNSSKTTINPAFNTDLSLRITQPLLAGFGTDVARTQRKLSKIALERSRLDFQATVIRIVRQAEVFYHELSFAKEQHSLREKALELAKNLFEENKKKEETGIATSLDVLQAEVGVANATDRLLKASQTLQDAKDRIVSLIGYEDLDTEFDVESLEFETPAAPNFDETFERALENHPRILIAMKRIQQREVQLRRAKRNRLPDVNLNGTVAHTSLDDTLKSSLDKLPDGDSYNWNLGLSVSLPWGLQQKRSDYLKAELQLDSEATREQRERQLIARDTRIFIREVDTIIASLAIKELSTKLSEEEFNLEKKKFDAGLSTGRRVLEAQQRKEEAKLNELRARTDLLNAYADLRELDGSSLARYGINFE